MISKSIKSLAQVFLISEYFVQEMRLNVFMWPGCNYHLVKTKYDLPGEGAKHEVVGCNLSYLDQAAEVR